MTEKTKTEKQVVEEDQAEAQNVVAREGPLKSMLVDYVGSVVKPENGEVTVEMIIKTLATEFPEFLFVVAKENWIRGYQQAMNDVEQAETERSKEVEAAKENGKKKLKAKAKKKTKNKVVADGEDDSAFAG